MRPRGIFIKDSPPMHFRNYFRELSPRNDDENGTINRCGFRETERNKTELIRFLLMIFYAVSTGGGHGWSGGGDPLMEHSTYNHHQLNNFMPVPIWWHHQQRQNRNIEPLHKWMYHGARFQPLNEHLPTWWWCRMSHKCKTNAHGDNEYFC